MIRNLVVATILATTLQASDNCPTQEDRIGFGIVGALQGAAIGGPIGAIWGLGTIWYANDYECTKQKAQEPKNYELNNKVFKEVPVTNEVKKETVSVDKKLEQVTKEDKKDLEVQPQDVLVLESFVNFNYDSYVVNNKVNGLNKIKIEKVKQIIVDGHTDKRGTNEYNFALGLKRANAVKEFLLDYSIAAEKIKTVSYGESNPISNDDAKNRRVDLTVQY